MSIPAVKQECPDVHQLTAIPQLRLVEQTKRGTADRIRAHFEIMRVDHWVKNVFVLPGIVVAGSVLANLDFSWLWGRTILGLLAVGLVASSNYVINEVADGPFDAFHPKKSARPVPSGRVNIPFAYAQWLGLFVLGLGISSFLGRPFVLSMASLWLMGCFYNLRPIRFKDRPYIDVLTEAINNPIRMLAGWYIVSPEVAAPASLLASYWMIGCYFMALKRVAEFRMFPDQLARSKYRKSLASVTQENLLVSVLFYVSGAMLFFGAFVMRYKLQLLLSFPFVAWVTAAYFKLSFEYDSAVQAPEKLYRELSLVVPVLLCSILMIVLLNISLGWVDQIFALWSQTALWSAQN